MKSLLPAVALMIATTFAVPAAAQGNNPLVRQGESLYDELRFEEALQVLSAALVRAGNTDEDRLTIYRLLAFTYLALGREEEASGAYRSLLAIRPDYEPDSGVSPRFRSFFGEVRTRWEGEGRPGVASAPPAAVEIEHVSPPQSERQTEVELRASIVDPDGRVDRLVLAYRQGTDDVFRRLDTRLDVGDYVATIPAEDVRPPLVEYYFEALDASGVPIAARGDVAAPLRIAVEAPQQGGIATKWWFWTALAVVVAGGVTAAVVLTRSDGGSSQGRLIIDVTDAP